ncbi:MAG: tetratricopeptide repeat protein [Blastocatellia bacterium]
MPFEKEEPQPLAALIDRGQALMDIGKWREALKPLRQALVIEPKNGEALCRVSLAWLQLGDFEQALAYAEIAIHNEPWNEWGHRLRGLSLLRIGRKSEALASAEEAVRLAPYLQQTLCLLTEAQIANQRLSEARQTALRAREIAPEAPESHLALALVAGEYKSWPEKEEHLRKALSLNPTSYAVLNDLGVCLLNQKREREAIEMLRQAARANPAAEVVRNNLKISVVKYFPVRGAILVSVLCQLIMSAIARGRFWLSITASFLLLFMTSGILGNSLSPFPALSSKELNRLSPDVQNFLRAERRRESGYHVARLVYGLSAVILMWWMTIRILNPSVPIFPRSAMSWAIFAGLCACFGSSAAVVVQRATSLTSLWKRLLGFESNG